MKQTYQGERVKKNKRNVVVQYIKKNPFDVEYIKKILSKYLI